MTDGANKEMSELRKEMNEKVEKMMHKMKNSKTTQSVPTKKNFEPNTSYMETPKHTNNENGGLIASNMDYQKNRIRDNPFSSFGITELRSPGQPVCVQNFDSDDTVIINEVRTGEYYIV